MGVYAWYLLIPLAYSVGYGFYWFYWETASANQIRVAESWNPGRGLFYRYNQGYLYALMTVMFIGSGVLAMYSVLLIAGLISTLAVDFVIDFQIVLSAYGEFFSSNPLLIALVPAGILGGLFYRWCERD